jgi:hypothetical protein
MTETTQVTVPLSQFDESWLEHFYKECGREVTLAYTTLNQAKNWAMVITGAAISGLAFGKSETGYPTVPMFVGVVLVYVLNLRFFVRAILCYINLGRWNTLQADCLRLRLFRGGQRTDSTPSVSWEPEARLNQDIRDLYFEWLSPYSRKTQILSNLKLGFALLLGIPLFFLLWGAPVLWSDSIVKGLTIFAVGDTIVELNDFLTSKYFDNVSAYERRKARGQIRQTFPAPSSRGFFIASWLLVLFTSATVAGWPTLWPWLLRLLEWFRHRIFACGG